MLPCFVSSRIMYSVAWRRSVEIAKYIHDTLLTNLMGASVDIPMILVGNKCDLEAERCAGLACFALHVLCPCNPGHLGPLCATLGHLLATNRLWGASGKCRTRRARHWLQSGAAHSSRCLQRQTPRLVCRTATTHARIRCGCLCHMRCTGTHPPCCATLWRVVVLQTEEAFNVLLGRIYRGEFGTPEQERLCTCVWVYPLVTLACCSLFRCSIALPGSCAVLCNAGTKLTHAQQLNFIYMFKWALWFILVCDLACHGCDTLRCSCY